MAKRNAEVLFKDAIESENYLTESKLLTKLEIKQTDLVLGTPCHVFPYYTDGGICYDDPNNSMIELFAPVGEKADYKNNQISPYISTKRKNVTVACYLGKHIFVERNKKVPY